MIAFCLVAAELSGNLGGDGCDRRGGRAPTCPWGGWGDRL